MKFTKRINLGKSVHELARKMIIKRINHDIWFSDEQWMSSRQQRYISE